jgi:hypothetical protein
MTQRQMQWIWLGGSFIGANITKALRHRSPVAMAVAFCATAVWFLAGLMFDNLRFKKEVAEQRERLAQRRAAFRAARDAAHQIGPHEPRS